MDVPHYVADRIRAAVPEGANVVPGSTPVVAFGDASTARVATVGLNPSRIEFEVKGVWLDGDQRRLATHRSLGVETLEDASDHTVAQVLADCYAYFDTGRNPYWRWFRPLDRLLEASLGATYERRIACHLDLVQWATDPVWGELRAPVRKELIEQDREFLRQQLASESIGLVLANGGRVIDELRRSGVDMETHGVVADSKGRTTQIQVGHVGEVIYVGWRVNLQSSPGVSLELRDTISARVGDLASQGGFTLKSTSTPRLGERD
ncbi:hypothetical protein ACQP60_10250 [Isoptericola variabilis]|uniref:hypothetical protein n=1 Tax=Isoptericola variabilis TaxID=139208 RepID=UPI003D1DE9A7